MTGRLAGKVAVVTGGGGGIGSATARRFVEQGAQVVIGDVSDAATTRLADELGAAARAVHLDVREEADWAAAVQCAVAEFGRLDVLVNNAGVWRPANLVNLELADVRLSLDVNVIGTLLGMRSVIAPMRAGGGGSIVNVSSGAGMAGAPGQIAYGATKWAIRGMTKTAAMELGGSHGIRVNSIHPGPVDTPMTAAIASSDPHRFDHLPVPRVARPEEIAGMALYLASDDAAYVTGAELVIDGGLGAGPMMLNPADRAARTTSSEPR